MKYKPNPKKLFTAIALSLNIGSSVAQFAPEIELAEISATGAGFVINGESAYDSLGRSVSAAGDINGDGLDDIIVGAPNVDTNGNNSGASYVVFGQVNGFAATVELSELDGSNGFTINGITQGLAGNSVSAAGDVNGDGFDDIIIASRGINTAYVVFGKSKDFDDTVELAALDGTNGFALSGKKIFNSFSNIAISGLGDINGDGFDDVIIGAEFDNPNERNSGASYVVFGQASGFAAVVELTELDGSDGFVLNGVSENDFSGFSVSAAGDVNGDGFDDVIIGAPGLIPNEFDFTGASYVVFGRDSGFAAVIELSTLNGSDGFVLNGVEEGDRLGVSVSAAGDINGDGLDDMIIGAYWAESNGEDSGAGYVVFGKASGFDAIFELSELDGNDGFVINGIAEDHLSGVSVSAAGDVNNDGFDDVIIGAVGADPNGSASGASYVVFGQANGFVAAVELSQLDGNNGFVLNGASEGDGSGRSVSSAGDLNGDGFVDLIIGASGVDTNGLGSGASYVIFGLMPCQSDGHTYQVNNAAELNHAISCANQSSGADTIELNNDIILRYFFDDVILNPSSKMPFEIGKTAIRAIESEIVLDGKGHTLERADLPCELDGSDANNEFRLLRLFGSEAALSIYNIKLLNGCADGEGNYAGTGGAIFMATSMDGSAGGLLRLENVVMTDNQASMMGGGIYIHPDNGLVELIDASIFNENISGSGGAVYSNGFINQVQNSTFSSNEAMGFDINPAQGAAIWSRSATNFFNNTFYNNEAIGIGSSGGALYAEADILVVENNLFFSNLADTGADCAQLSGATVMGENNLSNQGFNLCPDAGIIEPLESLEIDSLANNGCLQTFADGSCGFTHALAVTSVAIDAGNLNATATDQRGVSAKNTRDVGAFEYDAFNFDVIFKNGLE